MIIQTTNQQPQLLNSRGKYSIANPLDVWKIITECVTKPLYTPIIPSQPVKITYDGREVLPEHITELILYCSDKRIDIDSEKILHELFRQTLLYYDPSLNIQDIYAVQAAKRNKMLIPSDKVKYLPADVIDSSKQLLAGQITPDEYFATMAFYTRIKSLGFYFANDSAWDVFLKWFADEIAKIQPMLPRETVNLCNNLQKIKLTGLTESFLLRDDQSQNNEPYSFASIFVFYLMVYESNIRKQGLPKYTMGQMPFSLIETFCPTSIILMNVEKHAHAFPETIRKEWDIIQKSLIVKPTVLNSSQIMKLTSVVRMASKMAGSGVSDGTMPHRSAEMRFRDTPVNEYDLYQFIKQIYSHTKNVLNSENTIKLQKRTYNRPSRRNPDNPDVMGKTTATIYKPDFHIYLDCSASITEQQYRSAVKAIIMIAKKMNVNIFFNSFSNVMSTTHKLHVKNRSTAAIYKEFVNIPKVSGGTNFEQIWHYINGKKKLCDEVSVVITDFAYTAPNHFVKHPRFLYYAPVSVSNWGKLVKNAENFSKSMLGICTRIRQHILI